MRAAARMWTAVLVATTGSAVAVEGQAQTAPATQRVVSLFEHGHYAAAKAALSAHGGSDAQSLYYLGRIAIVEDRAADAVGLLERALKADARNADYHAWLGIALGLQARVAGRFRQAMLASRAKGEFERAIALDPGHVEAREGLVQFYSIAPAIAGGSMRQAQHHAAEIARSNAMRGRIASGLIREREKDLAAAEREYRAAATMAPDSAAPLLALGGLYQRMEKWSAAFDAYERALALTKIDFPEALSAHYQLGRTGATSGERLDDSERALKRWLELAPSGTSERRIGRTRSRLGMVYARQGRTELARAEFEAALRMNPKDPDARDGLARLGR